MAGAHGVLGAQLAWIVGGDLAALVSPVVDPAAIAAPSTADLLRYQGVIQQQHEDADVLPMRFGGVLADEEEVRAHLDAQRHEYRRALARVAGCAEMGVRVLLEAEAAAPAPRAGEESGPAGGASGAAYLRARQRRYAAEEGRRRRAEDLLQREILPLVAPHCREHLVQTPPSPSGAPAIGSFYFLVPRSEVPAFRAALASLLRESIQEGAQQLMISGPWPPYSFV